VKGVKRREIVAREAIQVSVARPIKPRCFGLALPAVLSLLRDSTKRRALPGLTGRTPPQGGPSGMAGGMACNRPVKKFKAMSLEDKLEVVSDDKPDLFLPESLPRISRTAESNLKEGSSAWRTAVYGEPYNHPLVKDIVDSWYTKFYSDE
jgi:hypothetical protein